jgi:hypothetical protein
MARISRGLLGGALLTAAAIAGMAVPAASAAAPKSFVVGDFK